MAPTLLMTQYEHNNVPKFHLSKEDQQIFLGRSTDEFGGSGWGGRNTNIQPVTTMMSEHFQLLPPPPTGMGLRGY